ncbi:MAG TPA: TIGR00725 family protein, partial [Candidatus Tectomicrobia bacterium]
PIVTGLSEARNLIIVRTAEVLIAVGGGPGTLSEIAFAQKLHKPIISLDSWQIADDIIRVRTPQEAVVRAFELMDSRDIQGL